jgi:hypothetical protein
MRKASLVRCLVLSFGVIAVFISFPLFLQAQAPIQQPMSRLSEKNNATATGDEVQQEFAHALGVGVKFFLASQTALDEQPTEKTQGDRLESFSFGIQFLILLAVIAYAWITYQQWQLLADTLKQYKEQTNLFRQQTELSNRAWVTAEMDSAAGHVKFDEAGARVSFSIRTRNTGRSPAINLRMSYKVVNSPTPKVLVIQKELAQSYASIPKEIPWGSSLFPGHESLLPVEVTIDKLDLDKEFPNYPKGSLWLHVIGCVDYGIGSSPDHHQSFFYYTIDRKDGPMMIGQDVSSDDIRFEGSTVTGNGAN